MQNVIAEEKRLLDNARKETPLEKWGPYLSERQWGTVREDYSPHGDAWKYFTHDDARSRAYLWGEDGIAGICDRMQDICFAIALWNGKDPILKERLFGLANNEGNHGEDVKELYYHLDNLPTHFYMEYLYKYPQEAFPYNRLVQENRTRTRHDPEFEILDTGVFDDDKYFDVRVIYAKYGSDDIACKIEITNRGSANATVALLPTLWFYNRWQYGGLKKKPLLEPVSHNCIKASHERAGEYFLYFTDADAVLFTENETNRERIFKEPNKDIFVKDAFHAAVIQGTNKEILTARKHGTKCATLHELSLTPGETKKVFLRLSATVQNDPFKNAEEIFSLRKGEADEFYAARTPNGDKEVALICRRAFAGLLWSRQFYHFDVERWLGKENSERANGRNSKWKTLKNQDVISMPDKWEYPWYAAWDTAFHCIAMALIDPVFAKNQLLLLMREWYMNPQGQLPAYEWDFGDVNPPVHAFAALEIYRGEKKKNGKGDPVFLKKIFQKLIINFTWWVNRKDANGNNIFEGGFLGLDNIGIFNRNMPLGDDTVLEQTDGTAWMGMYALNMMDIALEIAMHDDSFEDAATKFYEHFVIIAAALNDLGLWNEEDGFFYDAIAVAGHEPFPLKIKSVVGLTPVFAVSLIEKERKKHLADFSKRMQWFSNYRAEQSLFLPGEENADGSAMMLSLTHREKLKRLLAVFLDEDEFLSAGGIRSLSKIYADDPYRVTLNGSEYSISYTPAEDTTGLYGGNSNWRGPVWMPLNYLFIRALKQYGEFYGDSFKTEFPSRSGKYYNLREIAGLLIGRLLSLFTKDSNGNRPVLASDNSFYSREGNDLVIFHEYFHGHSGKGLGASHQTGWTALLANLLSDQ